MVVVVVVVVVGVVAVVVVVVVEVVVVVAATLVHSKLPLRGCSVSCPVPIHSVIGKIPENECRAARARVYGVGFRGLGFLKVSGVAEPRLFQRP